MFLLKKKKFKGVIDVTPFLLYNTIMAKKMTIEEIKSRLPEGITIVESTYKGTMQKATFIDSEYGAWEPLVNAVLMGKSRHPKRAIDSRSEIFTISLEDIKKMLPPYVTIDESTYVRASVKCRFIDKDFGEFWKPFTLMKHSNKFGHPKRNRLEKKNIKLPNGEFVTPLCQKRGIPEVTAHSVYREFGPDATQKWIEEYKTNTSYLDTAFESAFKNIENVKCERWDRKTDPVIYKNKKPYRPDYKITYEDKIIYVDIDGLIYHCTGHKYEKDKSYHLLKKSKFTSKGLNLLMFRHDELAQKMDIVKSIVLSKLGCFTNKFYARKLAIKTVVPSDASLFFQQNHLMGDYKKSKAIGLYDKNELVSLISYKKYKNGIDISRFCNKLNTNVVGGLSRLLKEIERRESPAFIQSFVDLRYGNGDSLKKIGFELSKTTLGWKWCDKINTYNRLKCRANMDERGLSEAEYAKELGWYKIYDAGQAKFTKFLI